MTINEVSEYLKPAEKTDYCLAAQGKIHRFNVASSWRFRKSKIDQWATVQERREACP